MCRPKIKGEKRRKIHGIITTILGGYSNLQSAISKHLIICTTGWPEFRSQKNSQKIPGNL